MIQIPVLDNGIVSPGLTAMGVGPESPLQVFIGETSYQGHRWARLGAMVAGALEAGSFVRGKEENVSNQM